MTNYTSLLDNLNELKYGGFLRKQRSVPKLFPTFYDRVIKVEHAGKIKLINQSLDLWTFRVPSATRPGFRYNVYVKFKNIEEILPKYVSDKHLWNEDKTDVDYKKVAAEVLNNLDLESDCTCAADLYWGPEYIKTQRHAQYGDQENRPPKIRNPRQYGIVCKHGQVVFDALPMYTTTFAKFLQKFWSKEIERIVGELRSEEEVVIKPEISKELGKEVDKVKKFIKGREPEEVPEEEMGMAKPEITRTKKEIGKMIKPEKPRKTTITKEKPKTHEELAKEKNEKAEINKLEDQLRRTTSPAIQKMLRDKLKKYFEIKPIKQ
jgi:cytochrome c556